MTQLASLGVGGRLDSSASKALDLRFKSRKTHSLLSSLVRLITILALYISQAASPFCFSFIMWFPLVNSLDPCETRPENGTPKKQLTILGELNVHLPVYLFPPWRNFRLGWGCCPGLAEAQCSHHAAIPLILLMGVSPSLWCRRPHVLGFCQICLVHRLLVVLVMGSEVSNALYCHFGIIPWSERQL